MQVERSAQSPCLHELSALPERVAYVRLRESVDPFRKRKLCCGHHLRVNAGRFADDLEKVLRTCALGERAAHQAPRANLVPGDALQLEESLSVDELAAGEPCQRAAFEDLEMHR